MSFHRIPFVMASPKSRLVVNSRETFQDDLDETTPLLPPPSYSPHPDQTNEANSHSLHVSQRLVWTVLFGVLLVSLGDQIMESPQTRIFEAIICYRYYEKHDPSKLLIGREAIGPGAIGGVEEMFCKVGAVQNDLASLRGWQMLFDGIPTLLLAVPVGWAADRFGRKPIVLLGIVAFATRSTYIQLITWFWQAFDVRVTWASTLFASIGGGNLATTSVFFCLLSDITTEATRAEAFVRASAFSIFAAVLMPPLAALLMEINPWIPNLLGTVLICLTFLVFFFVPETLHYGRNSSSKTQPPPIPNIPQLDDDEAQITNTLPKPFWQTWTTKIRLSTSFLFHDWRVPALIAPFILHFLNAAIGQLLLQYVSTRYSIKLSKAIIITTIRNGFITLLLFIILPSVSKTMMQRFRFTALRRDLFLSRVSLILLAVGWFLTGLAPNVIVVVASFAISSLGYGFGPLLRSSLTYFIEKHHIARAYGVISVVDTLGMMAGSPVMARLFRRGTELGGGYWLGLPFYFLALLAVCFAVLVFAVRLRKGEDLDTDIQDES